MAATHQVLIYSAPGVSQVTDYSYLVTSGYDIVIFNQPQAVDTWLTTFLADDLLIIVNPSIKEALSYSAEILRTHPCLPIILVTNITNLTDLKQALEIGIFDCLPFPAEAETLLEAVRRSVDRQNNWQKWNRFSRVLGEVEDGFILVDLDGYLLMVNRSARQIFSIGDGDIGGKTARVIFHHPEILDTLNSQTSFPRLTEIAMENGKVFSAQASLIPQIGIAVLIQDITHLKELDRIKTDFMNSVSHDLRSPLTSIYGFVSLLDRVGTINEQQADFIRHIQSSVQQITALINDLMDLGRVEADYDIQMQDVDLKEIINQSIQNLDYQVNEKMQELICTCPDELPLIIGKPLHLQRMITNLMENAIKFTPPLGKISVQCRAEAGELILEVSDNGPGIPLEDQPRIFDKFYRGSNFAQDIPGTGLGLSIVKSIVENHHGRIWLDSSPAGTTVSVILPIK